MLPDVVDSWVLVGTVVLKLAGEFFSVEILGGSQREQAIFNLVLVRRLVNHFYCLVL